MSEEETFSKLQQEVGEWSHEQFADQPTVNPFIGAAEEFGELVDEIENSESTRGSEYELDSVGDMIVYMADFCYRRGLDLQDAYEGDGENVADSPLDTVTIGYGKLSRSILKRRQGIRMDEDRVGDEAEQRAITIWMDGLEEFAENRGFSLEDCVKVAWYDEVIDREWDSSYKDD